MEQWNEDGFQRRPGQLVRFTGGWILRGVFLNPGEALEGLHRWRKWEKDKRPHHTQANRRARMYTTVFIHSLNFYLRAYHISNTSKTQTQIFTVYS